MGLAVVGLSKIIKSNYFKLVFRAYRSSDVVDSDYQNELPRL